MSNQLQKLCNQFRLRTRAMLVRLGVARLVSMALGVAAALILLDFWIHFQMTGRFLALLVLLAVAAAVFYFDLLRPLAIRWTDQQVLDYLDRVTPQSQDRLINFAELSDKRQIVESATPEGETFIDEAVATLAPTIEQVRLAGVLRREAVKRWQTVLAAVGAVVVLAGILFSGLIAPITDKHYTAIGVGRLLLPWASGIRWPSSTWFELLAPLGNASVPEGEDFPVRVKINGRKPQQITLNYQIYTETEDGDLKSKGKSHDVTMFVREGEAEYVFPKLNDTLKFKISGGDGSTDRVTINVIKRPYIKELETTYGYPTYSLMAPKIVAESPVIEGLEGTDILMRFVASTPLSEATIRVANEDQPVRFTFEGKDDKASRRFQWRYRLNETTTYTVGLKDRFGNEQKQLQVYPITVIEDRPPRVQIISPQTDLDVTKIAYFPVEWIAEDDFGLEQMKFMVVLDDGQGRKPGTSQPAEPEEMETQFTGLNKKVVGKKLPHSFTWDLRAWGEISQGQKKIDRLAGVKKITYYVVAKDVNPVAGRGSADSGHMTLLLKTDTEVQTGVLLAAKQLLTEAKLGYENQLYSYFDSRYWRGVEKPKGDAPEAKQVLEEQTSAARAAAALDVRFKALMAEMQRNRLEDAFFQARLAQIGQMIKLMASERQPQIAAALDKAKPASAAEAEAAARLAKLKNVLTALEDTQKRASLEFRQIYYLLLDWHNLQNVLVNAKRLKELQEGVYATSLKVAPIWIGKEIEDLNEDDARRLETLGQQQDAIFNTQRALFEDLQKQAVEYKELGRGKEFQPLKENIELLSDRRITEKLSQCADYIKRCLVDATLKDQVEAIETFKLIIKRLEEAGKEVPVLADLTTEFAQRPLKDLRVVPIIEPEKIRSEDAIAGDWVRTTPKEAVTRVVEDYTKYVVGSIEQAMLVLQDLLDNQVVRYTGHTNTMFKATTRPDRYQTLRKGMLALRVQRAIDMNSQVKTLAAKHECQAAPAYAQSFEDDLKSIQGLVKDGRVGLGVQAFEKDLSLAVETSRQALAHRKKTIDEIQQRAECKGLDPFEREYLVNAEYMKPLTEVRKQLDWAIVLQSDVNGKSRRLVDYAAGKLESEPALDPVHKKIKEQAVVRQEAVIALIDGADAASAALKTERLERRLAELPMDLNKANFTAALDKLKGSDNLPQDLLRTQDGLLESLRMALENMDKLAADIILPIVEQTLDVQIAIEDLNKVNVEDAESVKKAQEKVRIFFDPAMVLQKLEEDPVMKKEAKEFLRQALAHAADPKYQNLLMVYYSSLLKEPEKKPGAATQPETP